LLPRKIFNTTNCRICSTQGMPLQLDSDLETFFDAFIDEELAQERHKHLMKFSTRKRIA
jgi:hypothetical protein